MFADGIIITPRKDNLNNKTSAVSKLLVYMCSKRNVSVTGHSKTTTSHKIY